MFRILDLYSGVEVIVGVTRYSASSLHSNSHSVVSIHSMPVFSVLYPLDAPLARSCAGVLVSILRICDSNVVRYLHDIYLNSREEGRSIPQLR